ncbi:MAG: DsbA family protein [Bacteroidetes bacterium]|nr:DsbA family protein [Bacteroidota bacterium]
MTPTLYYCYDAYCGWCYGFSPVMKKIAEHYPAIQIEVLSGGMILPENPVPIAATAGYIQKAYQTVEEHTGIRFGADYLWHINHPDLSDWFPHSEKPAIALCIFKEIYPEKQVAFASDLQYALHFEGRDLTDDEAYRHLLEKYSIQPELFYTRLHSEEYKEQAYYEFQLCKQLQVTGFPCVLLQNSDTRFTLLARGYTDYDTLTARLDAAQAEMNSAG